MFSKVPCEKVKKYVNIVQNLDRERENEDILTAVVNVTTEYKIDYNRLETITKREHVNEADG